MANASNMKIKKNIFVDVMQDGEELVVISLVFVNVRPIPFILKHVTIDPFARVHSINLDRDVF
jgi:hypothetical protein